MYLMMMMLTNSENEVTQEVREEHYVSLPPENIQFDTFLVLDEMHMILLFCPGDNQPDALFFVDCNRLPSVHACDKPYSMMFFHSRFLVTIL